MIGTSKRLRQQLTGEVAALVKNLEAYYQNPNTYNLVAGPRVDPVKFIRLALIKKGKINAEKVENDEFLRQSLHGNSDDIMLSKTKLEIEKILEYKGKKLKGKKVLVEGAPGIGKTMLALHLCRLWAENKLLRVQAHAHARIFAWLLGTCISETTADIAGNQTSMPEDQ